MRWVEEHALGLLDEHHRLTHYQGIILDITARKRAEAALLAGKEELEFRVAERTADLTRANEKLRREIAQRQRAMEALQLDETRLEALLDLNLMTEASVKEITHFAMEEAVRLTRSTLGYLAFVNESETVMTMHAWSERAMYDCLIAEKPLIYPVETTGLWGEAVRQRRPIITNDYQAPNPWKKGYPEGHVELRRHMNVPIMEGGRVVAVIGVANKETEYDDADVRQLRLLGTGMWRILERKRVVDALKENEERYRSLFAVEPDALVLLDAQTGQILEANNSACQLFGYELEEFLSLTALDISAEPEKTRAVMDGWQPGRTDKVPYRNSLRKDGTIFPTEIAIRHFELQGRRLLYAAYRDITARVRAEAEMEEAHERLLRAEIEKKQFYRQVIRAVTNNKLHLVDLAQIPVEGELVLETSFDDPQILPCAAPARAAGRDHGGHARGECRRFHARRLRGGSQRHQTRQRWPLRPLCHSGARHRSRERPRNRNRPGELAGDHPDARLLYQGLAGNGLHAHAGGGRRDVADDGSHRHCRPARQVDLSRAPRQGAGSPDVEQPLAP